MRPEAQGHDERARGAPPPGIEDDAIRRVLPPIILIVALAGHAMAMVLGIVGSLRFGDAIDALPDTERLPVEFYLGLLPFTVSGAVLAFRRPRNPIGWLLVGFGFLWTVGGAGANYGYAGLFTEHGPLPLAAGGLIVANSSWYPAFVCLGLIVFLFPTGLPPAGWWRYPLWIAAGSIPLMLVATVLDPGPLSSSLGGENPLGVGALEGFVGGAYAISTGLLFLLAIVALASLLLRFRRSGGAEREQLKWLFSAVVVAAMAAAVVSARDALGWGEGGVVDVIGVVGLLAVTLVPVAIAVAVLRYGLYELGRIVNRVVMYAVIAAVLGALYTAGVLLLSIVLPTGGNSAAVAMTTLGVAAAFDPLRRVVHRLADQWLYRTSYDPEVVRSGLRAELRDRVDPEFIGRVWVEAVAGALHPSGVRLWLREGVNPDES